MSELALILALAIYAKHIAMMSEINCGALDQDNGIYLVNSYYHFNQNASAYFLRTRDIERCGITSERYTYCKNPRNIC